jgi:hypothetical protein
MLNDSTSSISLTLKMTGRTKMKTEQEQEQTSNYEPCGVEGCTYNTYGIAPNHNAGERCESGKRPHCTCDTCF